MVLRTPDKLVIAFAILAAVAVGAYQSLTAANGSMAKLQNSCASDSQSGWEQIDNFVASSAQAGNVAVVCQNIGSPPWLEKVVASLYFRGSYIILPRRLFVAPPGTAVNEAKDFANSGWEPTPDFMKAHGIGTLIVLSRDAAGNPAATTKALEQPTEKGRP